MARPEIPKTSKPPTLRHQKEHPAWLLIDVSRILVVKTMNTASDRVNEEGARAHPPAQEPLPAVSTIPATSPPIPSYEVATGLAPPAVPAVAPEDVGMVDELPDYTPVDENQTTFMIHPHTKWTSIPPLLAPRCAHRKVADPPATRRRHRPDRSWSNAKRRF
jgi:hypothetical protein